MSGDDLVPLKRVLEEVGVGRVTMWRALNSGIDIPKPTVRGGRVFWKVSEVQKLDAALDAFKGRRAFEERRRQARVIAELRENAVSAKPARKLRRKRRMGLQLELFAEDD